MAETEDERDDLDIEPVLEPVETGVDEEEEDTEADILGQQESLYSKLSISSTATTQEVKRAYKKFALLLHPDKQAGKTDDEIKDSTFLFKSVTEAYQVLIDPEKRARYDSTGEVGDDFLVPDGSTDWKAYFDNLYTKVTLNQLAEYEKAYKYSTLETQDIYRAYSKTKGLLLVMIDHIPLSSIDDIPRFQAIVQSAIDSGELEQYESSLFNASLKKFPSINKRELKRRRDGEIAEKIEFEKSQADTPIAAIQESKKTAAARHNALIKQLERDSGVEPMTEPSEEEFMALQAKLFKKKDVGSDAVNEEIKSPVKKKKRTLKK